MTDCTEEPEYSRSRFLTEKRDFEKHLDALTDPPLSSLLDLCHSIELKRLLSTIGISSQRYVHGIDLLNALACYNTIVSVHQSCALGGGNVLADLLAEGADVNLCNERGHTAFECFARCERRSNRVNDIVRQLFAAVHRLVAAGLHVHPQNRRQYELVRARVDMRHFVEQQMGIDYGDELDCLTIDDDELEFPKLGCLVKLRRRQAAARKEWRPLLVDALRLLAGRELPGNCVDFIVKGLENYDLANVLAVAFDACLRDYRRARRARRTSSAQCWSPRRMLPRI